MMMKYRSYANSQERLAPDEWLEGSPLSSGLLEGWVYIRQQALLIHQWKEA